ADESEAFEQTTAQVKASELPPRVPDPERDPESCDSAQELGFPDSQAELERTARLSTEGEHDEDDDADSGRFECTVPFPRWADESRAAFAKIEASLFERVAEPIRIARYVLL